LSSDIGALATGAGEATALGAAHATPAVQSRHAANSPDVNKRTRDNWLRIVKVPQKKAQQRVLRYGSKKFTAKESSPPGFSIPWDLWYR
jgi:hypothetical protein